MWWFVAILALLHALVNPAGAIKQKWAINPETFMNVVSQEKFGFLLCKNIAGEGGDRVDICEEVLGHSVCWSG